VIIIVNRGESSSGLRCDEGSTTDLSVVYCCLSAHRGSKVAAVKLIHVLIEHSVLSASSDLLLFNLIQGVSTLTISETAVTSSHSWGIFRELLDLTKTLLAGLGTSVVRRSLRS
jgi:hypothetical protein